MKCSNCQAEILQEEPKVCPYCGSRDLENSPMQESEEIRSEPATSKPSKVTVAETIKSSKKHRLSKVLLSLDLLVILCYWLISTSQWIADTSYFPLAISAYFGKLMFCSIIFGIPAIILTWHIEKGTPKPINKERISAGLLWLDCLLIFFTIFFGLALMYSRFRLDMGLFLVNLFFIFLSLGLPAIAFWRLSRK
jgi:hypothetical protein